MVSDDIGLKSTEWALWVLEQYGDDIPLTNGEIVDTWDTEKEVAFCQDWVDNIIALNGGEQWLWGNERQMIKDLNLKVEE